MNSKRSARRSRRSQGSRQNSELPRNKEHSPGSLNTEDEWKRYFPPEQAKAIEEATETLRKGLPWLEGEREEARVVIWRAGFPRSICGNRQDDRLLRVLAFARKRELGPVQIAQTVAEQIVPIDPKGLEGFPIPPFDFTRLVTRLIECWLLSETDRPKTDTDFFSGIAERLKYLDNFEPNPGDYAVEALQNAFIGLMKSKYEWGKKGLPTKGEVTEMAKAHLEREGKSKKSGWTGILRTAGLDFLQSGTAGRPPKREVDENRKAAQEARSFITEYVEGEMGGNWPEFLRNMKSRFGKRVHRDDERSRSNKANEVPNGEDEESE